MIRIAIVEDQKEDVDILQKYLKQYGLETGTAFQISVFHDGLDIVSDYSAEYDIIFLDIQMKHLDGMTAAEKIRTLDEDVDFIFITSTIQFAVQGYMVDAAGYVLKPVPYLAFCQVLRKTVRHVLQKQEKVYVTIEVEGGQLKLDISQIYYFESQAHNILVHTEKGDYLTPGPLKKAAAALTPKGFSKCHNAYLVNLRHVTGLVQNNVLLANNISLPVSRTKKKTFMDDLTDYMGGM